MDAVKYIILAKGSEIFVIGHPNRWAHEAIAAKLIQRDPELKLVTGNYISVLAHEKKQGEKPLRKVTIMPGMVGSMSFIDYEYLRACVVDNSFWMDFDEEAAVSAEIKIGLLDYFESDTELEFKQGY